MMRVFVVVEEKYRGGVAQEKREVRIDLLDRETRRGELLADAFDEARYGVRALVALREHFHPTESES